MTDQPKSIWTIDTHDACLCKNGEKVLGLVKFANIPMEDTMDLCRQMIYALNYQEEMVNKSPPPAAPHILPFPG